MKAPYVRITATCTAHGKFQVERKPNKPREGGSARNRLGFYDAVKCPVCPFWATINEQTMIPVKAADTELTGILPGMEAK